LLDAMALVAVAAVASTLTRGYVRAWEVYSSLDRGGGLVRGWEKWGYGIVPTLLALSLAMPPLRMIAPRPRWRRLFRLPGVTAGLIAWLGVAMVAAQVVLDWPSVRRTHYFHIGPIKPVEHVALRCVGLKGWVPLGIAAVWGVMWAGRGWRAERSWIDRAGRALGAAWLVFGLAAWVSDLFAQL
jgi:hypothetical protein